MCYLVITPKDLTLAEVLGHLEHEPCNPMYSRLATLCTQVLGYLEHDPGSTSQPLSAEQHAEQHISPAKLRMLRGEPTPLKPSPSPSPLTFHPHPHLDEPSP